jgi:hypothetical protein
MLLACQTIVKSRGFTEVRCDCAACRRAGFLDWAAAETRVIAWWAVATTAASTGVSERTVRTGIKELDDLDGIEPGRQRQSGAGRPTKEIVEPELISALESIIDSSTRGYLMSALHWS